MRYKVDPGRNVVDIHEELVVTERLREPIMESPGRADGIISAIIDEYFTCHRPRQNAPEMTTYFSLG